MKYALVLALTTVCLHVTEAKSSPVNLVEEVPVSITALSSNSYLIDFGRVSFGNLKLNPPANANAKVTIHFGEDLRDGRINRKPPRTVRYNKTIIDVHGPGPVIAEAPADKRNIEQDNPDHPPAILTPNEFGVVLPFRWVEIEGWQGELLAGHITRRSLFSSDWDDEAASFESSNPMLNQVWELSRYSIKATTFAGIYVDGDRERIPYEADAYLNQLSHYATDNNIQMARDTFDHMMKHPTWPSEWAPHMVFMAYTDWMHTGDKAWLEPRYEQLKGKLLLDRKGENGLIHSNRKQIKRTDIVDWPKGERDGYVFTSTNTVVNAFHLRSVQMMGEMALALDNDADAVGYFSEFESTKPVFQTKLFEVQTGLYRDGIGTKHSSLHANLFPLAFELVPDEYQAGITDWLSVRGMRCSVYAAQYLLEGLFENGAGTRAIELITDAGDRSWRHMVDSGATITWEAWDHKYKPNQDWNHAWGAAPANLLPRFVLGAQPLSPGWKKIRIRPSPGNLEFAKGKVPTPLGPIFIEWTKGGSFELSLSLPAGMTAQVELPNVGEAVYNDGELVPATLSGNYLIVEQLVENQIRFEVQSSKHK